jgi:bifunctional DNA-binding transcriptional regulator/antitoxin component of YhaV-PrlF toxin-antitoxin module
VVEICSQVRKWGSSVGVVIPKEAAKKAGVRDGDKVCIIISKEKNPFDETFGSLKGKLKRPTEKILKEIDRDGWDE